MVSKLEWETCKRRYNYCCIICKRHDSDVGGLEQAHIKAQSKKGSQVLPMCSNCHKKFDKGLFNDSELLKIGIPPNKYHLFLPNGRSPHPRRNDTKTAFDEYLRIQNDVSDSFNRRY